MDADYQFLLFYVYCSINNPENLRVSLVLLFEQLGIHGRIRVASEGSNGIIGGDKLSISKIKSEMSLAIPCSIDSIHFYQSGLVDTIPYQEQKFKTLTIQVTKEVVSLDLKGDIRAKVANTSSGNYLTPHEFHTILSTLDHESEITTTPTSSSVIPTAGKIALLDIRNQYEVRIGTFKGKSFEAINPQTRQV